jgi:hypothetical protein
LHGLRLDDVNGPCSFRIVPGEFETDLLAEANLTEANVVQSRANADFACAHFDLIAERMELGGRTRGRYARTEQSAIDG